MLSPASQGPPLLDPIIGPVEAPTPLSALVSSPLITVTRHPGPSPTSASLPMQWPDPECMTSLRRASVLVHRLWEGREGTDPSVNQGGLGSRCKEEEGVPRALNPHPEVAPGRTLPLPLEG